ncbi:MAG: hypothetical protein ACRBCT_07390 [Alphaproteobacteria bacterium]
MNFKILLALGVAVFMPGQAYAVKNVSSPYVSAGEWEVESKTQYEIDDDNSVDGTFEQAFEFGYGVTDSFGIEAGIEFEDTPDEDFEAKKIEVEATFQFTEKGDYYIDSGVKFEYAHNLQGGNDEVGAKLLLAKGYDKFYHGANIGVETEIGDDADERGEWALGWKSKYKHHENFNPGFEYYADFGDGTKDYEDQKHLIGPVAYGDIMHGVEYEAGVLFGISEAAPDAALKFILEYEF